MDKAENNSSCLDACRNASEESITPAAEWFEFHDKGLFVMHRCTPDGKKANFFRHFHEDYEILFFADVKGEYVIENHKYAISPNDMLLIKPGKYHYLQLTGGNYERLVINVEPDFLPEGLLKRAFLNGEFFHLEPAGTIASCFRKIIDYRRSFADRELSILIKALLTEALLLIEQLDKSENDDEFKHLDEFNSSVIKYIRDNLTSIRSLEQMAAELYVSKSTLYHSFKKAMKISVMQYVRNKKVLHAQKLIRSGIKPTKACTLSGFDDYTTFYRSYKLFFGHSPGEK